MHEFNDKYVPCLINYLLFVFLTQITKKYPIVDTSTKNKIICETESINMWILADEAHRFTDFSNIMS